MAEQTKHLQITRRGFLKAVGGVASLSVLAACAPAAVSPATTPAATTAAGVTPAAVEGGGTLIYGSTGKSTYANLCAQKIYTGITDLYLRRTAFSGLVQTSKDFSTILPDLAESWEFDGTTCTFHLRKDVTWHDGEPFTAKDVVFTYKVIMHPASVFTHYYAMMPMVKGFTEFHDGTTTEFTGVTAVDDHTVAFDMVSPYRLPFLVAVGSHTMIPEHILGSLPEDQWVDEGLCKTDWALNTGIGTGPFKVAKHVPDEYIEFEVNENYYRPKPNFDRFIFRLYTDPQALAAALENGECHVGTIPGSEYERFKGMDHLNIVLNPGLSNAGIMFNNNTLEKKVRQAMTYAVDRDAVCQTFYYGTTTPAKAGFQYFDYGVGPDVKQYPYDPDQAKALLAEVGWDPEYKVRWCMDAIAPANEPLYEMLRGYWADVGIQSEYQIVGAEFQAVRQQPEGTDIMFSSYAWGQTPIDAAYMFYEELMVPFQNIPEGAPLIEQYAVSEDPEEMKQIVWQLQAILAEEAPYLFLGQVPGVYAISKKVHGDLQPIYALWTRNDWEWENIWVEA